MKSLKRDIRPGHNSRLVIGHIYIGSHIMVTSLRIGLMHEIDQLMEDRDNDWKDDPHINK